MATPANFRIGAGALSVNGQDVGLTTQAGIVVNIEESIHLHTSGKFGTTPIKATFLGRLVTFVVNMGEATLANLENSLAGVELDGSKLKLGGVAGVAVDGALIVLTPFDGTESWTMRKAVQTGPIEVQYSTENERVFQATFTGIIDITAPEDENLAFAS